ncbi:anhydro-N-acetylmuramic acid kinase [Hoeflea sp. TYP-13]|uniref:anhydro-N-acetylmuramic acid kinase n=1 Tax=Hoeflea sp. TYP-13 TaxID=3230023 RepID=UPI0034C659FC
MAGSDEGLGIVTAIGLMSGTSMDGIDVALIKSDGDSVVERGPFLTIPYRPEFRRRLAAVLETASGITSRNERPGDLGDVERELTQLHADAVLAFTERCGIDPDTVDLIGFHGQTVLHRPEKKLTVQIGDGQALAANLNIPVVYDMRAADMEAGGEGAPLAPAYHGALAGKVAREGATAFVNIGGISNITCVTQDGELHAFDTGPGNTLIDQWVETKAGIPFDQGGAIASEGGILRSMVDEYLRADFFSNKDRRSLDRNDFRPPEPDSATLEDGARSLARLTAEAIVKSSETLPQSPDTWIVCGGGRNNRVIMEDLAEIVGAKGGTVIAAEEAGLNGDAMEAEAWAYLAIRSRRGLPLSWPGTTGCRQPTTGGVLAQPSSAKSSR